MPQRVLRRLAAWLNPSPRGRTRAARVLLGLSPASQVARSIDLPSASLEETLDLLGQYGYPDLIPSEPTPRPGKPSMGASLERGHTVRVPLPDRSNKPRLLCITRLSEATWTHFFEDTTHARSDSKVRNPPRAP